MARISSKYRRRNPRLSDLPKFHARCRRVVRPRCAKCFDILPFARHLQGFTKCERHTVMVLKKFGRGKNAYTKMVEVTNV